MRLPVLIAAVAASLALLATAPAEAGTSVKACADWPAYFCVNAVSVDGGPADGLGVACAGTGCSGGASSLVVCTPYKCFTFLSTSGVAAGETGFVCVGTSCPP